MWMPDFILKWIGKDIAGKLQLQEDSKMDETKPWYQSKGIWTAVIAGLAGIYQGISSIHPLPVIPQWVFTFLGAMGLYSLRTADTKIG